MQNITGILSDPIFGIAPQKYAALFAQSTSAFGEVSVGVNTTTSLSVWALYGIVYFIVFNLGLFYFSKSMKHTLFVTILLFVALLVIYNSESMNYSLFFNFLPILGYYKKGGDLFENSRYNNCIQQKRENTESN